jgi:hypothetical protein
MINRCVLAAAICFVGMSTNLKAECVTIGGIRDAVLRAQRFDAFIFDGTVLRVEHIAPNGSRTDIGDAHPLGIFN